MRDTNDLLDELDLVVVESQTPVIEGGTTDTPSVPSAPPTSSATLSSLPVSFTFTVSWTGSSSVTVDTSHSQTLD